MNMQLTSKKEEELVLKNLPIVKYLVERMKIFGDEFDDLVSVGTIGLIKAAKSFDESKKIAFSTYSSRCIMNEILMYLRSVKKWNSNVSLEDVVATDKKGSDLTFYDFIPSDDRDIESEVAGRETVIKFISIILNCLSPRDRCIMLYKISGMKQTFIAKAVGVEQSYISRLEKKLINDLKQLFATTQQFKEVFKMNVVKNSYQISFSSKDIKNFNKIFATFLKNLTNVQDLPNFRVSCNGERIAILVPADLESFSFIAQIIQEIDDFEMTFWLGRNAQISVLPKAEPKKDAIAEETKAKASIKSVVKNRASSKQIIEYILTLTSFSFKDLKEHFLDIEDAKIRNALRQAKVKGLIKSETRGKYTVNKN